MDTTERQPGQPDGDEREPAGAPGTPEPDNEPGTTEGDGTDGDGTEGDGADGDGEGGADAE
jgi:hypothetical protein